MDASNEAGHDDGSCDSSRHDAMYSSSMLQNEGKEKNFDMSRPLDLENNDTRRIS